MALDPLNARHSDGGPVYWESGDFSGTIVEPYNAASASLFIFIVIYWLVRLRGRYRHYPLLTACLPILLVGGIGGTLYHATRSSKVFFLMDIGTIGVLGAVVSIALWFRLAPRFRQLIGFLGLLAIIQGVGGLSLAAHWAINLSYIATATIILVPIFLTLVRTGFRHSGWVWTALVLFGIAFFCRTIDVLRPPVLPMGTHWLWHTFGALTTLAISEYLYRISPLSLSDANDAAMGDEGPPHANRTTHQ